MLPYRSTVSITLLIGTPASSKGDREIETILGYKYGDEIVHRDNLVVDTGG